MEEGEGLVSRLLTSACTALARVVAMAGHGGGPAIYACAVIYLQDDRKPQYTPEQILE